jgi:hypothetical protein
LAAAPRTAEKGINVEEVMRLRLETLDGSM